MKKKNLKLDAEIVLYLAVFLFTSYLGFQNNDKLLLIIGVVGSFILVAVLFIINTRKKKNK